MNGLDITANCACTRPSPTPCRADVKDYVVRINDTAVFSRLTIDER